VGSIYKIIAKTPANRFKMVLEKINSKSQNAFIQGKQILDPIPIANKCLESRLRSRETGVICKMDSKKTHDHVNWDFLLYMQRRVWEEMVLIDSSLYLLNAVLNFGEQLSPHASLAALMA
jgi:hypothetical protein